jgi:hypothetical protein
MKIVQAQNVNDAYVSGMSLLDRFGLERPSRNGPVLVAPEPVTTHYSSPRQRVLFNKQRNANPFFHLFESLWMLSGDRDVKLPVYFVKRMEDFSDNGLTFNAAYGWRWRHYRFSPFDEAQGMDQLEKIVTLLRNNRDDRRIILQMWDPVLDLGTPTKDAACNVVAKFEVFDNALNMIVFNRSNDIIMGCYGANAVHFSVLQEYIAKRAGLEVGWYEQISSNFHAYLRDWNKYWPIDPEIMRDPDWYDIEQEGAVVIEPLMTHPSKFDGECTHVCEMIRQSAIINEDVSREFYNPFFHVVCQPMSVAYFFYRQGQIRRAIEEMEKAIMTSRRIDWLIAGERWLRHIAAARITRSG